MPRRTCYVNGMQQVSDAGARKLCQVIDALLADGPIQDRLADATRYLDLLEFYQSEIPPEIFNELTELLSDHGPNMLLTPEQERDLTNKIFSIYIEISGGALIF